MAFEIPNFVPAIPEMILLGMACLTLLVDLFIRKHWKLSTYLVTQVTLLVVLAVLIVQYTDPATTTFSGSYIFDKLSSIMKIFIAGTMFFVFVYARNFIEDFKLPEGEFYSLALLSTLGMFSVVSAHSMLSLYMGLEVLALPTYAMVALQRDSGAAMEAAMKYFILGAIASGFLLYGMSLIYGLTGHLELNLIMSNISVAMQHHSLGLILAVVMVVSGIAFKLGLVPFNMWVPDVYDGAPLPITLLISTAPKIAGLGFALRLLTQGLPMLHIGWQELFIIIAVLSIGIGNLVAIAQTNIKRMLGYSSIAHMGYMILGLIAATPDGYGAATFYAILYSIMTVGAFGILTFMNKVGTKVEDINDLHGLNTKNPWIAFMMLLLMFSMAGIPPLGGFFAKLSVLEALIDVHMTWLATYALLFAIVGSYYYLNVVKVLYFEKPHDTTPHQIGWDMRIAISLNGLAILALGIVPGFLFEMCRSAFGS